MKKKRMKAGEKGGILCRRVSTLEKEWLRKRTNFEDRKVCGDDGLLQLI